MLDISIVILTFNEEANIDRTLSALTDFDEVVIIDSFSDDLTAEIAKKYDNVTLCQRTFDSHSNQWNFGISKTTNDWVVSLDADYILSPELIKEIKDLNKALDSYYTSFKYCIDGKPLSGTILPPRITLFNKNKCTYIQDGHTQRLVVNGTTGKLVHAILHDDRKSLKRWLWSQSKYAELEMLKLTDSRTELSLRDKIRAQTVFAPFIIFCYCYFLKGGFLDGRRGFFYSLQRMYIEALILLRILERKLLHKKHESH